ncbi:ABC transporter ATP-binding protein [Flavonifractor hominis]|uniref:ABC transporter ATP-binding protein n=1 Tax=Flavonifractor hominis TaxID=3133178 RepID=A0ABV1ETZ0_9FIRM
MEKKLLSVQNLRVEFQSGKRMVQAVSGVSFDIYPGECFALVGESGCGKSTTAMSIMRLIRKPGRITGGAIQFYGGPKGLEDKPQDLLKLSDKAITKVRGKQIGMIFQNPLDSLNPVYTIGYQAEEGLLADGVPKKEARQRVLDMFRKVRITDPESRLNSYPHEISGGMRQRVMIAMMLCRNPQLLIADEPTTALDVTIQAGIIELMNELRAQYGTAVLMITHDFGIVADMADRVGVMYAGQLVEVGRVEDIFDAPMHPYTRLLMKALPTITKDMGRLETIPGSVPNLAELKPGCHFADRCPNATAECRGQVPPLREVEPGHFCACMKVGGGA